MATNSLSRLAQIALYGTTLYRQGKAHHTRHFWLNEDDELRNRHRRRFYRQRMRLKLKQGEEIEEP